MEAVRPKYLVPVHGEHRQLHRHKEWAESLEVMDPERIILFENGDVLEFGETNPRITGSEAVGRTYIDSGYGEVENLVVRDRRHLSYDGVIVPIVAINPTSGELEAEPEIVNRGFVDGNEGTQMMRALRKLIEQTVERASHESRIDSAVMQEEIRLSLKRFIKKQTGRQPMIIPVVLDV
jgi:ribonuclease J